MCYRTYTIRLEGISKPMQTLQPSREEIMAAAGYLLWMHTGSGQVSPETVETMKGARRQISLDLQKYYENKGMTAESCARAAELHTIVSTVLVRKFRIF